MRMFMRPLAICHRVRVRRQAPPYPAGEATVPFGGMILIFQNGSLLRALAVSPAVAAEAHLAKLVAHDGLDRVILRYPGGLHT